MKDDKEEKKAPTAEKSPSEILRCLIFCKIFSVRVLTKILYPSWLKNQNVAVLYYKFKVIVFLQIIKKSKPKETWPCPKSTPMFSSYFVPYLGNCGKLWLHCWYKLPEQQWYLSESRFADKLEALAIKRIKNMYHVQNEVRETLSNALRLHNEAQTLTVKYSSKLRHKFELSCRQFSCLLTASMHLECWTVIRNLFSGGRESEHYGMIDRREMYVCTVSQKMFTCGCSVCISLG